MPVSYKWFMIFCMFHFSVTSCSKKKGYKFLTIHSLALKADSFLGEHEVYSQQSFVNLSKIFPSLTSLLLNADDAHASMKPGTLTQQNWTYMSKEAACSRREPSVGISLVILKVAKASMWQFGPSMKSKTGESYKALQMVMTFFYCFPMHTS